MTEALRIISSKLKKATKSPVVLSWDDASIIRSALMLQSYEYLEALEELVRISDRNHWAWNKVKEILKLYADNMPGDSNER